MYINILVNLKLHLTGNFSYACVGKEISLKWNVQTHLQRGPATRKSSKIERAKKNKNIRKREECKVGSF